MKSLILFIATLLFISCGNQNPNDTAQTDSKITPEVGLTDDGTIEALRDSFYNCSCERLTSKLEEIPNTDTNAYRITIKAIDGTLIKSKLIDTRPSMSRIIYCNELYTVVSFACGGPCHAELFVFTDKNRPDELYEYSQPVNNDPKIISYVKNEQFDKLIFRNVITNKEMIVNNPAERVNNYGKLDSMILQKESLVLHFTTESEKHKTKTINIKSIL